MQRLLPFLGVLRDFLNWMLVDLNYEDISGISILAAAACSGSNGGEDGFEEGVF